MNFTLTELNWINTELTWALEAHHWLVRAALQHNLNLLLLWINLYCRKRYRNKADLTCVHDKPTTAALHNTSLHCFRPDGVFHRVVFGLQKSRTSTASEIWITSRSSTAFTILVNTFVKSEDSLDFSCKHTQTSSLLCCSWCFSLLVFRCLWSHTGSKHSKHWTHSVWWEPEDHTSVWSSAVSWSSREIWSCSSGSVCWETDWTLLLGDWMEPRCCYISVI